MTVNSSKVPGGFSPGRRVHSPSDVTQSLLPSGLSVCFPGLGLFAGHLTEMGFRDQEILIKSHL